jgi:A/G-specific adenine glycosylase
MLLARRNDGSVQLVQRPARGIWGGLWSLPEFGSQEEAELAVQQGPALQPLDALRHSFTHFDLVIRPLRLDVTDDAALGVADSAAKSMGITRRARQASACRRPSPNCLKG